MNSTNNQNTAISLKGSEFYGEYYADNNGGSLLGYLYRLADRRFVVVEKEAYSGKVLNITVIDGSKVRRFRVLDIGYSRVSMYCPK